MSMEADTTKDMVKVKAVLLHKPNNGKHLNGRRLNDRHLNDRPPLRPNSDKVRRRDKHRHNPHDETVVAR